jgi:hypothetical protein
MRGDEKNAGYCGNLDANGERLLDSDLREFVQQLACILVQIALSLALSFCIERESFRSETLRLVT